jgi:putative membrane protein
MKKNLTCLLLISSFFVWSCNNTGDTSNTSGDTANNNAATTDGTTNSDTAGTTSGAATAAPLSEADQQFVMEAAKADLMEIQSANIAQQNAESQRVKDYASMMLRDHTTSSNELKSFVAGRNVMLPDSLPTDARKHMDAMAKMKGKAFDNHYMKMMTDDHSKVISKFENASKTAGDPQLKTWAEGKLPTLRMHLDSAKAIRGGKM